MDIFGIMSSINKYGRYLVVLVVMANLVSVSFAGTSGIQSALQDLCQAATMFLSAAIIIMIILAGAIYAIGQVMGAETRARASVWATAMLTGAVIGTVIYILTPYIIQTMLGTGTAVSIDPGNPCQFTT